MKELITITETENGRAVSARELHKFLDSKQQFSDWIKNRIVKYGLVENQDFEVIHNSMNNPSGGRPFTEYALTIDTAKELSMVESNDKGKQARQYFIEMEKKALNPYAALSKLDALRLAVESEERNQLLESEIKKQAPKVQYHDNVLSSKSVYVTNQIAKELGTSAITLNRKLHRKRIIYKQNDTWMLYQKFQDKGYSKTKTYTYTDSEGKQLTRMQLVWTEKGRQFIHGIIGGQNQNQLN